MTVEIKWLPGVDAPPEVRQKAQAVVEDVADGFSTRLGYTLPYSLKLQFIEDHERPNDYREHIMYLSLHQGEFSFGGKTYQVRPWAFDKTVIAHEFAHFLFWDLLASEVTPKGTSNNNLSTEFHMAQEGFCDYMSAVVTGIPAIGAEAITPPLRDLTDWNFEAHAEGPSPQFMGWGPFLWWLHTHLDVPGIALQRVVLESIKYMRRGDGLDAVVQSLQQGCRSRYSANDCTRLQNFIHAAYLEHFKPAFGA